MKGNVLPSMKSLFDFVKGRLFDLEGLGAGARQYRKSASALKNKYLFICFRSAVDRLLATSLT